MSAFCRAPVRQIMKKYLCDFNRDYSLGFTNRVHPISHWVRWVHRVHGKKTKFSGYMIYVKEKKKDFQIWLLGA